MLRIEANGKISMDLGSPPVQQPVGTESPVVPVVHSNPLLPPPSVPADGGSAAASSNGSADDEGSRDSREEEEEDEDDLAVHAAVQSFLNNDQLTTPRTRRRVENLKQGLAARRIQRTWKHFYEEVGD